MTQSGMNGLACFGSCSWQSTADSTADYTNYIKNSGLPTIEAPCVLLKQGFFRFSSSILLFDRLIYFTEYQ